MAIFLYSLSFTLLPKMNLFLLKEKKKRKKYICKNHTSSPCAKIMCLAARTSFWGQMAFFFSCKTSKKKKIHNNNNKNNLLSQHLALNYWPLSVAATEGPLVLETCDVERPRSPGESGCNCLPALHRDWNTQNQGWQNHRYGYERESGMENR